MMYSQKRVWTFALLGVAVMAALVIFTDRDQWRMLDSRTGARGDSGRVARARPAQRRRGRGPGDPREQPRDPDLARSLREQLRAELVPPAELLAGARTAPDSAGQALARLEQPDRTWNSTDLARDLRTAFGLEDDGAFLRGFFGAYASAASTGLDGRAAATRADASQESPLPLAAEFGRVGRPLEQMRWLLRGLAPRCRGSPRIDRSADPRGCQWSRPRGARERG
ncbi:MAG: hypothetical protein R3F17_10465 [Planctomycetota bacterium]